MGDCSFENLVSLLDRKLDPDGQTEVLDHIRRCGICHEAVYSIIRDRESEVSVPGSYPDDTTHPGRHAGV